MASKQQAAAIDSFVKKTWEASVTPQLEEYIKIPNQSPIFDPEWATNGYQEMVVDLFLNWLKQQPLSNYNAEV